MKHYLSIIAIVFSLSCSALFAQVTDSVRYSFEIEDITIRYIQPIQSKKETIQEQQNKVSVDSVALRDNISISMADVLSKVSSVFIKSYGRATVSTASFRGASPSHTQVTWNGMKIASPMLGMVDFSTIPSYFVDEVGIYKGANSVEVTGGSFGGTITLETNPEKIKEGIDINYIQGVSSFSTFDQYLKLSYGQENFKSVSQFYFVSSKNDFKYTNYRKKRYETDETGTIAGYSYPTERNKNGEFKDLHFLQELYYKTNDGSVLSGSVWYMKSDRGIPMLNVDYRDNNESVNNQTEQTFRCVVNWEKDLEKINTKAAIGYNHTDLDYIYLGDAGNGNMQELVNSQSEVNSVFVKGDISGNLGDKLEISGNISAYQHFVESIDRAIIEKERQRRVIGYDKARFELSGLLSVKYTPTKRLGLALYIREEMYENNILAPIPAVFVDYKLIDKEDKNWTIKASYAKNCRYPTLNDLYFMPGGNDTLKTEKGDTFDFGSSFGITTEKLSLNGELSIFDSWIKDWILWLPTYKGFWSPVNIMKVNSYGLEATSKVKIELASQTSLSMEGNFTITHSVNKSDPINEFDKSTGKQLVYIPVYSSAFTTSLAWRNWDITYKWNYYSKRHTTTSNEYTSSSDVLGDYFMNDVSFGKTISAKVVDLSFKLQINNIFNEEYESVLSRPMARRSFGLFVGITPKIKH